MGNRAGSSPVTRTIYYRGVAQVVAHQTGGLGVASSSLVTPTKNDRHSFECLSFLFEYNKTWTCETILQIFDLGETVRWTVS